MVPVGRTGHDMIPGVGRVARWLSSGTALALAWAVTLAAPTMVATPAAAQFNVGGFHIVIHGMGGGYGYHWRHHSRHASRHGRHHRDQDDEPSPEPEKADTAPTPVPAGASVPSSASARQEPRPASGRPEPRGPDLEPSK
jgi:hypothetical protein